MDQKKIGLFIMQCRKDKNMTQEELANKLNVSSKSISRWENGKTMPDYGVIHTLCKTLDISVNELLNGEKNLNGLSDKDLDMILKEYYKMKKQRNILKIIAIVMGIVIIHALVYLLVNLAFIGFFTAGFNDRYDITTDTSKYMDVIGVNAKNEYQDKWGMKEDIFPENINNLDVSDFKMVYYNPWDKQFLAYMVVNYDAGAYQEEMNRLKNYKSTDYLGYYGVTGFNNYTLLAVEADSYQGFVYAITPGNNQIIYVELIFCNYFMDIKYKELIPNEYLPDNFDATVNNKYRKTMLK